MEAVAPTRASALRGCSGHSRTDRSQEWRGSWKGPSERKEHLGLVASDVGPGLEAHGGTWSEFTPLIWLASASASALNTQRTAVKALGKLSLTGTT